MFSFFVAPSIQFQIGFSFMNKLKKERNEKKNKLNFARILK
jgi:hypothetical protein